MDLVTQEEKTFLQKHITDDPVNLLLRTRTFPPERLKFLAAQLTARQKARVKLPGWYTNWDVVFPPPLSVEQASSERTAHFKASILEQYPPVNLLVDMTGGMGVDALAFARHAARVVYLEQQPLLAKLAAHNLLLLGGTNVEVRSENGLTFLRETEEVPDWVYLDPARRDRQGGKLVALEDCDPAVSDWLPLIAKSRFALIKTSPLIDIDGALRILQKTAELYVVSVDNECREVLFLVKNQESAFNLRIHTINLKTNGLHHFFDYNQLEERSATIVFSDPGRYLFEANASLMKAGAFRSVAARFGLRKIAANSHLYTADELPPNFPGRIFEVTGSCKPDRKALQAILPDRKANLTARNFPETVEQLRKKLGLADGGDVYIFATTLQNGTRQLIITRRMHSTI